MVRICCDNSNKYEYDLEESQQNLLNPLGTLRNPLVPSSNSKQNRLYHVVVLVLLVTQMLFMITFGYFGLVMWKEVNPMVQPLRIIVENVSEDLPNILNIANETSSQLPQIRNLLNQINGNMPEIIEVINKLNSSIPQIESILDVIDTVQNLQEINNLIEEIPEIINVINFINASIPEIEYIIKIFSPHKNTTES
jgi:hypothetical protein